eukprot:352775-Chlamydomonas_euryale.AAC.1
MQANGRGGKGLGMREQAGRAVRTQAKGRGGRRARGLACASRRGQVRRLQWQGPIGPQTAARPRGRAGTRGGGWCCPAGGWPGPGSRAAQHTLVRGTARKGRGGCIRMARWVPHNTRAALDAWRVKGKPA